MWKLRPKKSFLFLVASLAPAAAAGGVIFGYAVALHKPEVLAWAGLAWTNGFIVGIQLYRSFSYMSDFAPDPTPLDPKSFEPSEDLEPTTFYNAKNAERSRRDKS